MQIKLVFFEPKTNLSCNITRHAYMPGHVILHPLVIYD